MRVVSDSSPFIALNAIGRLGLLPQLFDTITVPRAVANEVKSLALPAWVNVVDLSGGAPMFEVPAGLGRGEVEAIRLALQLGPDWLLLDDGAGRRTAHRLGIRITGVLGILLAANRAQIITDIRPDLDRLVVCGFRIAPALYQQLLNTQLP